MKNQLYIVLAVGYILEDVFERIKKELDELANQIGSFITYLENKHKSGEFVKK